MDSISQEKERKGEKNHQGWLLFCCIGHYAIEEERKRKKENVIMMIAFSLIKFRADDYSSKGRDSLLSLPLIGE